MDRLSDNLLFGSNASGKRIDQQAGLVLRKSIVVLAIAQNTGLAPRAHRRVLAYKRDTPDLSTAVSAPLAIEIDPYFKCSFLWSFVSHCRPC